MFFLLLFFYDFLSRIEAVRLGGSFESVTHLSLLLKGDELLTLFEEETWESVDVGSTLHSVRAWCRLCVWL